MRHLIHDLIKHIGFTISLHDRDEIHAYNRLKSVRLHIEFLTDGTTFNVYGPDGNRNYFDNLDDLYYFINLRRSIK